MSKKIEKTFTAFFEAYSDDIFRFLFWRCGDEQVAKDLMSEVFSKAWQKWETFDGKFPKAWVFQIARNLLIDHYRRVTPVSLDETDEQDTEDTLPVELDKSLNAQRLYRALNKLNEKQRTVIELRILQRFSVKDVASMMSITDENVRISQFRALKELRKYYDEEK